MYNLKIGKLTLDEKELESMSSRDFNRDLLLSTRMSSSDLASFGIIIIYFLLTTLFFS
jgi:hypothetical protein